MMMIEITNQKNYIFVVALSVDRMLVVSVTPIRLRKVTFHASPGANSNAFTIFVIVILSCPDK